MQAKRPKHSRQPWLNWSPLAVFLLLGGCIHHDANTPAIGPGNDSASPAQMELQASPPSSMPSIFDDEDDPEVIEI